MTTENTKEQKTIEAIFELINDYGVGLSGEILDNAIKLINEGQEARQKCEIINEQVGYALRYRHGEDLATFQRTCKAIMHISGT